MSLFSRLLRPIRIQSAFKISRRTAYFGPATKPPGWRRRRFYRRLTFFSLGFAAWFFTVDADLITYSLDLLRRKNIPSLNKALERLSLHRNGHSLKAKTIWIVGASSGIGEHTAYELCALHGAAPKRLILSARRVNELQRVANECHRVNPMVEVSTIFLFFQYFYFSIFLFFTDFGETARRH